MRCLCVRIVVCCASLSMFAYDKDSSNIKPKFTKLYWSFIFDIQMFVGCLLVFVQCMFPFCPVLFINYKDTKAIVLFSFRQEMFTANRWCLLWKYPIEPILSSLLCLIRHVGLSSYTEVLCVNWWISWRCFTCNILPLMDVAYLSIAQDW